MDLVVLDQIALDIDVGELAEELRVTAGGADLLDTFRRSVDEALGIARPKTAYRLVSFDKGDDDTVIVDGVPLQSRVLSFHLEDVYRVFPFVATCGRELDDWAHAKIDVLEQFWAHAIMDRALTRACHFLEEHLKELYRLDKTGMMSPGSLFDWPVEEQRPLFSILGDIQGSIGVHLTEGLMMDPVQSVSGILFPTDEEFEECSLCPREDCPKRRAPFEEHLYETRYGGTQS